MEIVWLQWHGPFAVAELDTYDNNILDLRAGIYVILDSKSTQTGWKPDHELLYVGMVLGQSFYERMVKHQANGGDDAWRWIMSHHKYDTTLKVAAVYPEEGKRGSEQLVKDIENLLIFRLQPPANVQGKESYRGRDLRVVNMRRYIPLPEELRFP
jgi:hypothetical protein